MLPFNLLLGFGTGLGVHDRGTLRGALWVGLVASAITGVLIMVWSDEPAALVFGISLGFANHLIGLCLGSGIRGGAELLARGLRSVAAR